MCLGVCVSGSSRQRVTSRRVGETPSTTTMKTMKALSLMCLTALMVATTAEARVTRHVVDKDDRSLILLREPFGFSRGGTIEIELTEPRVYLPEHAAPPDKTKLGFFITAARDEGALDAALSDGACVLDVDFVDVAFTFADVDAQLKDGEREASRYEYRQEITVEGDYMLFFANCEPHTVVSFGVTATFMNKDARGRDDYLGSGEKALPSVYYFFFLLDVVACATWAFVLGKAANKRGVRKIHWLMLALMCFKTMSVLAQAGRYHITRLTGSSAGWTAAYYVFTVCRSMLMFSVIALVGMGWSFLKPFLHQREKNLLMAVIPLQIMANVANVIVGEEGPADEGWFAWQNMFLVIDIMCCCAVLVPIVWSIKSLRDANDTSEKKTRNLQKLILFRHFYVMTVAYIYFTRIVVYLLKSVVTYKYRWTAAFFNETAALVYYVGTGYMFRPEEENMYFALKQDEDEDGVEMSDRARWPPKNSGGGAAAAAQQRV